METLHRMPERVTALVLASPVSDLFEASFTDGMQQGGEGMYEMLMGLWGWGFAPEDIAMHVDLFYGDADDILDPQMPLRVAERLPDCTPHAWKGAGHYGFVDRDRWTQFPGAVAGPPLADPVVSRAGDSAPRPHG